VYFEVHIIIILIDFNIERDILVDLKIINFILVDTSFDILIRTNFLSG
jgi:hypothetical protein